MGTQLTINGRWVQGGLALQPKKDNDGKPVLDKESHQPVNEAFIAIAVPKNDPNFNNYWSVFNAVARAAFPSLFDANGNCTHPRFAWKIQDGDGIDKNGKSVKDKPGFAGHWVFKMATRYEPRVYTKDSYGNMTQLSMADAERLIKRGYRVAVSCSIDGNGVAVGGNSGAAVPGLYVSQNLILFVAPDEEIISGPDPNEAFAGIQSQMPAAGGPAAAGPAGLAPPPLPGAGAPPALPGNTMPAAPGVAAALPSPAVASPAIGNAMPAPAMPGAGMPLPPAAAQPQFQMQPSAQGATREQLHALGWSDEQLIAAGHMVRVA